MSESIVQLIYPDDLPLALPADWPRGFGVAILWVGGQLKDVMGFHGAEDTSRILKRAKSTFKGRFVLSTDMSSPVSKTIYDALKSQLRTKSASIVDPIADYAVNFEFAYSEGLDVDDEPETDAEVALPYGYLPARVVVDGSGYFDEPYIERGPFGYLRLVLPGYAGTVRLEEDDILCRADGVGIAIDLSTIMSLGACPEKIEIPQQVIPVLHGRLQGACAASVVQLENYLVVTPFNGVVSSASVSAEVATQTEVDKPEKSRKKNRSLLYLSAGVWMACFAVVGGGAWLMGGDEIWRGLLKAAFAG